MEMTLLARNVTIAKLILRSLISLFFVLGLSKPVVVQVDQDTQMQSSESDDSYWKYYQDCDRWGVVLATPTQFETIVESKPVETEADAVVENNTNQNSITDTPPTAHIAVHEKLQKPVEDRQSVIEFFMSLDVPLLDDVDKLLLAAEIESDMAGQSNAVSMSPLKSGPLQSGPFQTASHSRIVDSAPESIQPELIVAELGELELEIGAPIFPGIGLELPAATEQGLWGEIFDFGDESAYWDESSDWDTSESCPAEAAGTYEGAAATKQLAGPLPTIALTMSNAILRSPVLMNPSSSLDEMASILHFRFGRTLWYRMGQDVLFNARSEFALANQDEPAQARPALDQAETVEYSRQFAENLNWLSFQLHKAAISVSRSADTRAAKIDRNLK